MAHDDDLRRIEEHVAEARRMVHRQKGLIIRLRAAGVNSWDAQRILWLLESNLKRFEEHRDRLKAEHHAGSPLGNAAGTDVAVQSVATKRPRPPSAGFQ